MKVQALTHVLVTVLPLVALGAAVAVWGLLLEGNTL